MPCIVSHSSYGHLTRRAYSTPSNISKWFKEHHVLAFSLIRLLLLELYRTLFLSLQWQSEFTGIFLSFWTVLDHLRIVIVLFSSWLFALCFKNHVVRNVTQ